MSLFKGAADSIKDTHATHGLLSREASRIKNSASISRQREKANRKLIEYFCKVNEEKRTGEFKRKSVLKWFLIQKSTYITFTT